MNYFFSIVMPAYNAASTIEDSIKSVVSQTYGNFELIVIDDFSVDETVQIVERLMLSDQRIKLIKKNKNEGVADARNTGLDYAQGNFIAFLDSDDKWTPNKLDLQVKALIETDADVIYSSYYRFNNDGIKNIVKVPEFLDKERLLRGNPIGNLTAIYNFDKYPLIRQKKIGHEDFLFWLEIFYSNSDVKGYGIQEPLAFYRVAENGKSLSGNKFKAARWSWDIYRNHLKFNIIKSLFYFIFYVFRAFIKRVK